MKRCTDLDYPADVLQQADLKDEDHGDGSFAVNYCSSDLYPEIKGIR